MLIAPGTPGPHPPRAGAAGRSRRRSSLAAGGRTPDRSPTGGRHPVCDLCDLAHDVGAPTLFDRRDLVRKALVAGGAALAGPQLLDALALPAEAADAAT